MFRRIDRCVLWHGIFTGINYGIQEVLGAKIGWVFFRDLRELDVKRANDRLMVTKLVVGGLTLNIISAYASHACLNEEVKRHFWNFFG